jgi:plastocyanin
LKKFKPGDKVRFTYPNGHGHSKLIHGQVYTVHKCTLSEGSKNYMVYFDKRGGAAFAYRFELVHSMKLEDYV